MLRGFLTGIVKLAEIPHKLLVVAHAIKLVPVIVSAAVALALSLLVVAFGNDIEILGYSVSVAVIGIVGLLLTITLLNRRHRQIVAGAVFAAFIAVTAAVVVNQSQLRPHVRWMMWSHRYKSEVLRDSAFTNSELKHLEWEGDGWGSAATGDWMGYVVFDPSDSLAEASKSRVPAKVNGIPCTVVSVRRLEHQWYSVVLDMNQFWDKMHPAC